MMAGICAMACAQQVSKLRITLLSTMVADLKGKGEWGFSALVQTDSSRILFDVGGGATTVIDNAEALNVSLKDIRQIVLSHNHIDHTAGLQAVRRHSPDRYEASSIYIGPSFFLRTSIPVGMTTADSLAYVSSGGHFTVIDRPQQIDPGIYLTGPIPRRYAEKNYPPGKTLTTANGVVEDNVPEDISMVIRTEKGLVVLTGCGHSGIANTLEYVAHEFPGEKVVALIGGMHLLDAKDEQVDWTAGKIKAAGIQYFIGAHCTGLNSVYRIRQAIGLSKENCLVGTVGMSFDIETGIKSGWLK